MNTSPDVMLVLAQWFSPAFPIGAFSFSHGLETLVDSGAIRTVSDVQNWLDSVLRFGAGRNDIILMAAAYRARSKHELIEIDALSSSLAPSFERLIETREQGHSFGRTVNAIWATDLPPLTYPVSIGAAARSCDMPLAETARMYLHSFATSLVSAAIRLVPLGQTEGHACILELSELCSLLSQSAIEEPHEAIGASGFITDIASMSHETQYSRMFRS